MLCELTKQNLKWGLTVRQGDMTSQHKTLDWQCPFYPAWMTETWQKKRLGIQNQTVHCFTFWLTNQDYCDHFTMTGTLTYCETKVTRLFKLFYVFQEESVLRTDISNNSLSPDHTCEGEVDRLLSFNLLFYMGWVGLFRSGRKSKRS